MHIRTAKQFLEVARAVQQAVIWPGPVKARNLPDAHALFDALIEDAELRDEVRQLFFDGHYSQAVEEGYKFLNNLIKRRTGLTSDGASLMTASFGSTPLLRLNQLRTRSQQDQQHGYMRILEGSMIGVRNPRAHEHVHLDDPRSAVELLALCNHLVRLVRNSTRVRRQSS